MRKIYLILILTPILLFANSSTLQIPTVKNFQLSNYLGTWYEIVRMPHRFEKNLHHVTATYSLLNNGKIEVKNRGYNTKKKVWKDAFGKAWIPDETKSSELRVSFFWPFSAAYRIIYLEDDYSLALVTSKSSKYFWMLSRSPEIEEEYYNRLIKKAKDWGFDTSQFVKVLQSGKPAINE